MMVECILALLTEKSFLKISNEDKRYTVNDVMSAALLFKLLMKKAIVDTRARIYQLKYSLENPEIYMGSINSNIQRCK